MCFWWGCAEWARLCLCVGVWHNQCICLLMTTVLGRGIQRLFAVWRYALSNMKEYTFMYTLQNEC